MVSPKLSKNQELVQLLTIRPFPNMATIEIATRCGIRALSGFSALDPDERSEGDAWPPITADADILFCLRVLATCASMIRFQEEQILQCILREDFSTHQAINGALTGHGLVVQACSDIAIIVAVFFGGPSASKRFKEKFLRALDTCNAADPVGNSAYVIETDDHSGSVGPEMTLLKEPLYSAWVGREDVTDPEEIEAQIHPFEGFETLNALHRRGSAFEFWTEWFQGFLDGKPLDWELQRRVALIEDAIWKSGPEAVAQAIDIVRSKLDLEKRIEVLQAELRRATVSRHGIGGNLPPEPLDDIAVAKELIVVWQPLEDLKDEIANDDPNPGKLRQIIEELALALNKGISWCLRKGDLVIDTAIKWAIPAGGTGYLALNPDKLEAVIDAAKKVAALL